MVKDFVFMNLYRKAELYYFFIRRGSHTHSGTQGAAGSLVPDGMTPSLERIIKASAFKNLY